MPVYVDTSAWIALHEPRDEHHASAKDCLSRLRRERTHLVTGTHTLIEFIDGLTHHYDQATAARELERLQTSASLRIEPTHDVQEAAAERFQARPDWNIDLSDALSFAFMENAGIDRAFAYDDDFRKPGFDVLR